MRLAHAFIGCGCLCESARISVNQRRNGIYHHVDSVHSRWCPETMYVLLRSMCMRKLKNYSTQFYTFSLDSASWWKTRTVVTTRTREATEHQLITGGLPWLLSVKSFIWLFDLLSFNSHANETRFALHSGSCKPSQYSLVQWNWFSVVAGCIWVTCIQRCQRTSFTAPVCASVPTPWSPESFVHNLIA